MDALSGGGTAIAPTRVAAAKIERLPDEKVKKESIEPLSQRDNESKHESEQISSADREKLIKLLP